MCLFLDRNNLDIMMECGIPKQDIPMTQTLYKKY